MCMSFALCLFSILPRPPRLRPHQKRYSFSAFRTSNQFAVDAAVLGLFDGSSLSVYLSVCPSIKFVINCHLNYAMLFVALYLLIYIDYMIIMPHHYTYALKVCFFNIFFIKITVFYNNRAFGCFSQIFYRNIIALFMWYIKNHCG